MNRVWTLVSALGVLVAASLIVALVPTSFVLWSPGQASVILSADADQSMVTVQDRESYPVSGSIVATARDQSSMDSRVTLPVVIRGFFHPDQDVIPRDAAYTVEGTGAEAASSDNQVAGSPHAPALVAALRHVGITVIVRPMVTSVREGSPADGLLLVGDFILAIDDQPMTTDVAVRDYIRATQIGSSVEVRIQRGKTIRTVMVEGLVGSPTNQTIPSMGATVALGYTYSPTIDTSRLGTGRDNQARGLAVALATYDLLSREDGTRGGIVAAVGIISAEGTVSRVAGINEHAASAADAGAEILLIPADNCSDLRVAYPNMHIVPVSSLRGAINALDTTNPPHC